MLFRSTEPKGDPRPVEGIPWQKHPEEEKAESSDDEKEEKFAAFTAGQIRVLVTKPVIGAWGLNWQHCAHMTAFSGHSIFRRFLRQRHHVNVRLLVLDDVGVLFRESLVRHALSVSEFRELAGLDAPTEAAA